MIDLTFSWRYYDPAEFFDHGVQHVKVGFGSATCLQFEGLDVEFWSMYCRFSVVAVVKFQSPRQSINFALRFSDSRGSSRWHKALRNTFLCIALTASTGQVGHAAKAL